MSHRAVRYLACALLVALVVQEMKAERANTYRGAVVEYMPVKAVSFKVTVDQARAVMDQNLAAYDRFMTQAKASRVEVIVFPEYGLTGPHFPNRNAIFPYLEPIPNAGANPCSDRNTYPLLNITYKLSCMAKKHGMVLAVNLGDVQHCTASDPSCPPDLRYQFNTLVVFSADGTILSKYHKTNLYKEPEYDVPPPQPLAVFELFGQTFGTIICFDIMFAKPQVEMMARAGVNNLIFASWWVNTPPMLTATQIQQAWSRAFGMNMLAANAGYNARTSGSGIFSQGLPLSSFSNPSPLPFNKLLISDLPKLQKTAERPHWSRQQGEVSQSNVPSIKLALASSKPLTLNTKPLLTFNVEGQTLIDQVEVQDLACKFTWRVASQSHRALNSSFFLYAVSGYLTPLFPILACGVASCPILDAKDCITLQQRSWQTMFSNQTLFSSFSLEAIYHAPKDLTIYPVSSMNAGELFSPDQISYARKPDNSHHLLATPPSPSPSPVSLLHVGFLGRTLDSYF